MRTLLSQGMYVRVGVDAHGDGDDYRDYRIGQVANIDLTTQTATLAVQTYIPTQKEPVRLSETFDLNRLERCRILPDSDAVIIPTGQPGRVLVPCDEDWVSGELRYYYVQIGESVTSISESDLAVASNRQDPNPFDQMRRYELHQPAWRRCRDQVIKNYAELHNATFGIEDLVGSRILLLAHQADAVATVLGSPQCRYILADEVGLGKTVEACVILKGLRRRHLHMQTLIIVPQPLLRQWHNELNDKFWLDFPVLGRHARTSSFDPNSGLGAMVSAEDLVEDACLWQFVSEQSWGMLIVDEVHHLSKNPILYERIRTLSLGAERVLLCSATPIQRRAKEYLTLLALMDPAKYRPDDLDAFERMLGQQQAVRDFVSYHTRGIDDDLFDPDEFIKELDPIVLAVEHDRTLAMLASRVGQYREQTKRCIDAATAVLSYLSENYRIESRMIRNRRVHLKAELPARALDDSYSYEPGQQEASALDALLEYLSVFVRAQPDAYVAAEYCRILLHAAASSPHALESVLQDRSGGIQGHVTSRGASLAVDLHLPAPPREERQRVRTLIQSAPMFEGEQSTLENLRWCAARWREETDIDLATGAEFTRSGRLQNALLAIDRAMREPRTVKVLVFTSWPETIEAIRAALVYRYRREPHRLAQFHCGVPTEQLQRDADRFQEQDACRIMLCDELGGEGRNFQVADRIIHVDIPWTPSQIEQRIGRVDRLGRTGIVPSVVLFARDWPEHDLLRIWQDAFALFTRSMSGMEIVLEGIQDELAAAICDSPRDGLRERVGGFVEQAGTLRKEVETEQHFERAAVNQGLRRAFQDTSEHYRDGEVLREALLGWANMAGLRSDYHQFPTVVRFDPRDFSEASMHNAKLSRLPNMREALRRSLRPHELIIRGTFNRDVAVRREDLVFFAPGTDPWTDGLIANAFEADRGRSCAILRAAPALREDWRGFDLLFSITINPRPLYALRCDPAHLFRAQGFLRVSTYRLLVSVDGEILDSASQIAQIVKKPYDKPVDKHLGRRSGTTPPLTIFRRHFPSDQWTAMLYGVQAAAQRHLAETFSYMEDEAVDARKEFARRTKGWRAARQWMIGTEEADAGMADIDQYEQISAALVEGIRCPLIRLESACLWWLRGGTGR